jgi:hypothetical protein
MKLTGRMLLLLQTLMPGWLDDRPNSPTGSHHQLEGAPTEHKVHARMHLLLLLLLLLISGWLDDWPSSPAGTHHQGAPVCGVHSGQQPAACSGVWAGRGRLVLQVRVGSVM